MKQLGSTLPSLEFTFSMSRDKHMEIKKTSGSAQQQNTLTLIFQKRQVLKHMSIIFSCYVIFFKTVPYFIHLSAREIMNKKLSIYARFYYPYVQLTVALVTRKTDS